MIGSRRWFLAAAVLQVLIIVGFAAAREATVRFGTEVVLQTVPVDPRDVFRGDYVVLRYEISSVELCEGAPGSTVYLGLREEAGGVWGAGSHPQAWSELAFAAEQGDVVIRGRVASGGFDFGRCQIAYGIESYFVPEGTGHRIERLAGRLRVRVAVDGDGQAVIKELILPEG